MTSKLSLAVIISSVNLLSTIIKYLVVFQNEKQQVIHHLLSTNNERTTVRKVNGLLQTIEKPG